ncbi:MAG TPA: hypothetical protein VMT21_13210, partial [Gemmatimonadales bacterium]|nr:hypothetical protein [Gemmatimonadales bacterium]
MTLPTYVPERTPSPRAQELGQRLALVIAEYQQSNPDVSDEEIRVATEIAAGHVSARRSGRQALIAAVVAAVAALGAYLYLQRGSPAAVHVPSVLIATAAVIV